MKTPEQYAVCRVNGYLECSDPGCLGGRQAYLPAYRETLTLRHEWDDQYVGVLADGKDFIRESVANWKRYLVATPWPMVEAVDILRLCPRCAFMYLGEDRDLIVGDIVDIVADVEAFKVTEVAECQGIYGNGRCDFRH